MTVAEGRGATLPLEKPVINKRGAAPRHPFQWLCPLVRYHRFLNHLKGGPWFPPCAEAGIPYHQLFSILFSDCLVRWTIEQKTACFHLHNLFNVFL